MSTLLCIFALTQLHAITNTISSDPIINDFIQDKKYDLDGMLKSRIIRVLVIPSEVMFHVDKGKKSGLNYELMMLFQTQINKHFPQNTKHLKTRVVFIPVAKDKLIPGLLKGLGDIAVADISITPKRKRLIDFSVPYVEHINAIVVTGPSSPQINTLADLSGKEVHVHKSSSYYEYLQKTNFYLSETGLHPIKIKSVPEALDDKDILEVLNTGLINITIMDEYLAKLWTKVFPKLTLHSNIILKKDDAFAWMIRKNSPQLLKEINTFIKENKKGTHIGNILINRYVKSFKYEDPTITKMKLKIFDEDVSLFKKYAKQYQLNYLLLIAQAYQESKLNQKAKSKAGAIGIMQLMPKTGKSMKVGDITKLEPNIHAGIKYHRWIINNYFNEGKLDSLNQTLFAFASYNAGPSRIRGLRKLAKERGYNPNIWFDNVEMLAAEKIGAETVNYVSNIYEYYVAYYLYEEKKKVKQESINKTISKSKL